MFINPARKEELEQYLKECDVKNAERDRIENERNEKINKLPKLEKGRYKIKLLKEIRNYDTKLGNIGDIVEVYNEGARKSRGSLNSHQDNRALVYDYGMSGTDNYYPTIDFEIIEYLGK